MNKAELREIISAAGVKQWQIAEKLGIREEELSRRLRHELGPEDEEKIKAAISTIAQERKNNATDQTE